MTTSTDPAAILKNIDKVVLDQQVEFLRTNHSDAAFADFLRKQIGNLLVDVKDLASTLLVAPNLEELASLRSQLVTLQTQVGLLSSQIAQVPAAPASEVN